MTTDNIKYWVKCINCVFIFLHGQHIVILMVGLCSVMQIAAYLFGLLEISNIFGKKQSTKLNLPKLPTQDKSCTPPIHGVKNLFIKSK